MPRIRSFNFYMFLVTQNYLILGLYNQKSHEIFLRNIERFSPNFTQTFQARLAFRICQLT
jgi:hypothetical protein